MHRSEVPSEALKQFCWVNIQVPGYYHAVKFNTSNLYWLVVSETATWSQFMTPAGFAPFISAVEVSFLAANDMENSIQHTQN